MLDAARIMEEEKEGGEEGLFRVPCLCHNHHVLTKVLL